MIDLVLFLALDMQEEQDAMYSSKEVSNSNMSLCKATATV